MSALIAGRTRADRRRRAISAVHALRITQRRLAILAHIALGALAHLVQVAHAAIGALLVALRVRSFSRDGNR